MSVRLTDHAVIRYQERVRPALTVDQARAELARLAENGEPRPGVPGWAAKDEVGPGDLSLEVSDGIILVCCQHGSRYVAVTCKTRAGMGDAQRLHANRVASKKRQTRKAGREKWRERRRAKAQRGGA